MRENLSGRANAGMTAEARMPNALAAARSPPADTDGPEARQVSIKRHHRTIGGGNDLVISYAANGTFGLRADSVDRPRYERVFQDTLTSVPIAHIGS